MEMNKPSQMASFLSQLNELTAHHYHYCKEYRSILDGYGGIKHYSDVSDIPAIAVRLFKLLELKSISDSDVFKQLHSSGTTGQRPASIYLDKQTASAQAKALVDTFQTYIGKERAPMIMVDAHPNFKNQTSFSARSAGLQGLSIFGRDHFYALNENMELQLESLLDYLEKYKNQRIIIFGFTFLVWSKLLKEIKKQNTQVSLDKAILIHGGGWKKMQSLAVDNVSFKRELKEVLGIHQVHNFYGMVEQTGSVFVECEHGVLHESDYGKVLIRKKSSQSRVRQKNRLWDECEFGEQGLIQVMSTLPKSYPGHNLLTEDLGTILGKDDCPCGRKGHYFSVDGRQAMAELRGCSDSIS